MKYVALVLATALVGLCALSGCRASGEIGDSASIVAPR
jgi:hypothetical protein